MFNTILLRTNPDVSIIIVFLIFILLVIAASIFVVNTKKYKEKPIIVDYIPHSKICQVSLTISDEILIETAEANYKTLMFTTDNNGITGRFEKLT